MLLSGLLHVCKLCGSNHCVCVWFQVHVQSLEGLLVEDQVLLLAGSPLEDASSLVECGISEHCTLEVAGRLLGGQFSKWCIKYGLI